MYMLNIDTRRPVRYTDEFEKYEIPNHSDAERFDAAPPGQSGFIAPDGKADPHYRDQQQLYTSFDCKSRPVTDAEIEANTVSRRELTF